MKRIRKLLVATAVLFVLAGCDTTEVRPAGFNSEITIGTYTERLVAVPTMADTTFYLKQASDTYLQRKALTGTEAGYWAETHGYVIEW